MISFLGEVVASGYLFLEKVERQSFQAAKWTEHGLEVNEKRGNQNDCECFACLTACILISVPPGDLPNPGIEPKSLTLQANSLPAEPQGKPF